MKTLVYKRTHSGDPDERGIFGINDCMGRVRDWSFEAVIGVGGIGDQVEKKIAGKINWIGIKPHRWPSSGRGSYLTFDHFLFLEGKDYELSKYAYNLAQRIYSKTGRQFLVFSAAEQEEINRILKIAKHAPASLGHCADIKKYSCNSKRC